MRAFQTYVQHLQELLQPARAVARGDVDLALDGQPSAVLRRLVPVEALRADGAFFTGSGLARRLLLPIAATLGDDSVIIDPTCGAGDLLLAAADHLPVRETLSLTLKHWGQQLVGRDIHPEFITAAVTRIALAAARRGATVDGQFAMSARLLGGIRAGSCLDDDGAFRCATHIVMNPPFTSTRAPTGCVWGAGSVNSAAVFLDYVLRYVRPGVVIAAILPDVLRSGSRYGKWRRQMESLLDVTRVEIIGQFASNVDVDVFLLVGKATQPQPVACETARPWAEEEEEGTLVVGDLFDVGVGALVPYRDPRRGPWRPVVAPREIRPWETVRHVRTRRRFAGSVVEGPFVAVRRTSRPGDRFRALGTIIEVNGPVVVENHLIVLRPRDRQLRTCQRLLASLQEPETTAWLDQRIRCRHLTVSALRSLPIALSASSRAESNRCGSSSTQEN